MRRSIAYMLAPTIRGALENPELLTLSQAADLGQGARALLKAAWAAQPRDRRLIALGISAVVRTYATDHAGSDLLVRQVIEPDRLREYGHEEVPALARELGRLFTVAPDLCAATYAAAFSHVESSDERTLMRGGVLVLTSTRRQDYNSAHYQLANQYPDFLRQSPAAALHALIAVRTACGLRRLGGSRQGGTSRSVQRSGQGPAVFWPDASGLWDERQFTEEAEVRILNGFEAHLDELASREPERAVELVELVLGIEVPASIWRRMFAAGARNHEALADLLAPLAGTRQVLESSDLAEPAIKFLATVFPHLDEQRRGAIEEAILSMADADAGDSPAYGANRRDRHLGRLPEDMLVSAEARERYAVLKEEGRAPFEPPPLIEDTWRESDYSERDYFIDQGVDVHAEANQRLHILAEPARLFAEAHLNDVPSAEASRNVVPNLRSLLEAVINPGPHKFQVDAAWGHLAAAARAIARQPDLECESETRALAATILLGASKHEKPDPHPDDPAHFDQAPSWSPPAPRVDAVDGLVLLASRRDCDLDQLLTAIERLRDDPATVVRYHLARAIRILSNSEPDMMWTVIDALSDDVSTSVREALVSSLHHLLRFDMERSFGTVRAIYAAIETAPGSTRLRDACVRVVTDVYIWEGDQDARAILDDIVESLPATSDAASNIDFQLRAITTVGPVDSPDVRLDAARTRAIRLIERMLVAAIASRRAAAVGQPESMSDWSSDAASQWKEAMQLIDKVAVELSFSSGSHDARRAQENAREPTPAEARLYAEASGIIDALVDIGLPSIAQNLLETLEHFVDVDPRGVFMRIVATIRAGQVWGYQYDSLAESLFVRLVERYIAEHRTMLQQDLECSRALVEILDIFVRAGWPSAHKITYGLSEIYR
jgi:hypothetical protein